MNVSEYKLKIIELLNKLIGIKVLISYNTIFFIIKRIIRNMLLKSKSRYLNTRMFKIMFSLHH